MSFSRFVCWTLDGAATAIAVDATEPSDAVFLATHHPAHIRQRPPQQARGGHQCTEEQVRELLLKDPADPLLIPVVGQSGAGKSHLVRWLKASLAEADEQLHVVHIPKYDTSLKRVIERVIEGFDNDDFNEVRSRLTEARDAIVEAEAPGRLLNELALSFETWKPERDDSSDFRYFEYLAGPNGMASLLYDKVFRKPLLAKGGTIRRFVSQALHGKREVDKGEPLRFDPGDLPTTLANVDAAAPGVRAFYRNLIDNEKLKTLAAVKLTEFLQPAVRDLIGVDAQEMGRLFQRVRELLAGEGRELILLIEDFTVLQAIQRELLDALLIPARQGGRERFCPLRSVLAVTTGYFQNLEFDTVRARLRFILDLDVALEDIEVSSQMDFVGRYLNAARLGEDALDSAAGDASARGDQRWVPNACDDCIQKRPCHEAFGTTQLGHGLYPFNTAALSRCLGSQLGRPDVQGRFDPRVVLKNVLEYTLIAQGDSLKKGTFPNERFAQYFKNPDAPELDALVEQDIQVHDQATADRRKVLLTIWGDAPPAMVDLHPAIHDAFDIPLCGHRSQPESPPPPQPQPPRPPAKDIRLDQELQAFAKWRQGTALPQRLERRLRGLVHGNVVAHMDWERLVPVPKRWTAGGRAFSTDRILFHRQPRHRDFIYLAVDPTSPSDASAIEALLKYEHHGDWSFENGARSFRSLRIALDRWAADVRAQLGTVRKADQVAFENAIHALILGAIAYGLVDARQPSAVELIDAIFVPILEAPSDAEGPWEELRMACIRGGGSRRDGREHLQARVIEFAGTSKGGSGPQMIDVAAILPVGLKKMGDLEITPRKWPNDGASQHLKHVLELLPRALSARRDRLVEWQRTIMAWGNPQQFDADEVVTTLLATIDQARTSSVSVQPSNASQLLQRLGDDFVARHPRELWDRIKTGLRDFDSLSTRGRLAFLAQQQEEALLDISRFASVSGRIIGHIERQVADDIGGGVELPSQVESAIKTLHREFQLVGAALESLAEIDTGGSG